MTTVEQEVTKPGSSAAVRAVQALFTPELRLLLLCLRWPLLPQELETIAAACNQPIDWLHFLALLRRHRVAGLAARSLRRAGIALPQQAGAALRGLTASTAMQAMALSVESLRLQRLLGSSGVQALFLKGPSLAMLAYGDVSVRHSKDVDLLIPADMVAAALQALRQDGYKASFDIETLSRERQALWFRNSKAMDWTHTEHGTHLELHWRLTDLPLLDDVFQAGQCRPITMTGGQALQTLAPDALLAYLCVHGAMHGWMRLKWLADVYALLPHGATACEAAYRSVLQLHAGRAAGQAFLLCHDLFDLPLTSTLQQELERDPVLRLLRRSALRLLQRGGETAELEQVPFGTTSVYLSRLMLGGGVRHMLRELQTWSFRPDEVLRSKLPRPLLFLFPLVRVGGWLRERLQHGGRSPQPRA